MEINNTTYRTKQFLNERDLSSISYEVKRTRASWDPSLSIPGTDRRGGWRCPPGTRYGGQITDRFGRNCGWGVSRRIANEISDLGERLENVGDKRRSRRNAQKLTRNAERAARPGLVERVAGNVARALETGDNGNAVEAPQAAQAPRVNRGAAARRSPRLRRSEERRMNREIVNPGAPRTGEPRNEPSPRRPRPVAPAARRRPAAQQVVREKPQPVEVIEEVTPPPAKKAPVKKVAAKKKAVKKKAPVKKAAARRVTPAAGGNAEPPRLSTGRPTTATPKPQANTPQQRASSAAAFTVGDEPLSTSELKQFAVIDAEEIRSTDENTTMLKNSIDRDMSAWNAGNIAELRQNVENQDGYVSSAREELQEAINNLKEQASGASNKRFRELQIQVLRKNQNYATALHRRNAFNNRLNELDESAVSTNPPLDGLRHVFGGRQIGYERDYIAEAQRLRRETPDFDSMSESTASARMREYMQNMDYLQGYINNLNALDGNQMISLPNEKVIKASELKRQIEALDAEWVRLVRGAQQRIRVINENRIPGVRGSRQGNTDGYSVLDEARREMLSLANSSPEIRFSVVEYNNRYFVLSEEDMSRAMVNGFVNPQIIANAGGLPLASELPEVSEEVAEEAKKRVLNAAKSRQKILADYLNDRYGEGNAPWKEMNRTRMDDLLRAADRGDADAAQELVNWAKAMYSHEEIQGRNGKTYRTVARATYSRGGVIAVSVNIQRKNPDGRWSDVGTSTRNIYASGSEPKVYNSTMFINVAEDKNSGIQTIYNQHAFMYAKAAGFKEFSVSAVDDGVYVWGRIGFKDENIRRSSVSKVLNEVSNFRAGRQSIITNEEDARIFEHLAYSWIRNNNSVRHIDFIMALRNEETSATAKKRRDTAVKSWFISNMPFRSGVLNLEENYITADPRED